ncbi:hypothetical protein [Rhizobium sp. BR 314]
MFAFGAMANAANVVTTGIKSDKIVTVTFRPLAVAQKRAVARYDSARMP